MSKEANRELFKSFSPTHEINLGHRTILVEVLSSVNEVEVLVAYGSGATAVVSANELTKIGRFVK
jgi:hypothetical protein